MKSRRFIGSPEPAPALADYTKEMRVTESGVKVSLRGNNRKPRMSRLDQKLRRLFWGARPVLPDAEMVREEHPLISLPHFAW
jgi:hypothetical protein